MLISKDGYASRLLNRCAQYLYWPVCRSYARHLKDRPATRQLMLLCSLPFFHLHRFWPDFLSPVRFSEKLWSRMLLDRDPRFTVICDKYAVRDYVANIVGREYLIPLLWSGINPKDIPYDELPNEFVIKANHGCGFNIICTDKKRLNISYANKELYRWLNDNYCEAHFLGIEWGYKNIRPRIVIEKFIAENNKAPIDFKFWCFGGRVESISVHFDRHVAHRILSTDRDFIPGGLKFNVPEYRLPFHKPTNFYKMVQLAEKLSREYAFLRVDLYCIGDDIYFSELTPYPGGTAARFLPVSEDYRLGGKWN